MQTNWFVYLVECSDSTLYCGITNNIELRIEKHNLGKGAKYTKSRRPVKLLYFEIHINKSEASKREWQIKRLSRSEKLALKNPSK
jgi:putative endonuclease